MRAVNLMPRDGHGRSQSAAPLGSGSAVYVLLAGLAALVALVALWATANKQIGTRESQLQRVTAEVAAAEKRAGDAAPYVAFAKLAENRVQTVTSLSATRFDWAHAMREVSRVLPADVWLTGMSGASGASGNAPTPTTSAAPAPTITLTGCTHSQSKVARLMARLRSIDGVRKIALKSSEKPDSEGDTACPAHSESDPRFTITISFAVPGAPKDTVDATGRVTASGSAATTPAGGSQSTPTGSVAPVADNGDDG